MLKFKTAEIHVTVNPNFLADGVTISRIVALTTYKVRCTELATADRKVSDLKKAIPASAMWQLHAATDEQLSAAFTGSDLADAKAYRDFWQQTVESRDNTGVTASEWDSLSAADRVNISLLAETMARDPEFSVGIPADALEKMGQAVSVWYNTGRGIKDIYKLLDKTAYAVLSRQGNLFRPRKLAKIADLDLRHFCAGFHRAAKWREVEQKQQDGSSRKTVVYDYDLITANKKAVEREIVTFINVHLLSRNKSVTLVAEETAAAAEK